MSENEKNIGFDPGEGKDRAFALSASITPEGDIISHSIIEFETGQPKDLTERLTEHAEAQITEAMAEGPRAYVEREYGAEADAILMTHATWHVGSMIAYWLSQMNNTERVDACHGERWNRVLERRLFVNETRPELSAEEWLTRKWEAFN